ncbi:MAG: hypothetical protein D6732_00180 [Methanobacteriota archaeon]|nr:MAG: hypothetical protein D6732_00180 [Euryarchaeota archaeon]
MAATSKHIQSAIEHFGIGNEQLYLKIVQLNYILDACKCVIEDNRSRMFTHNKQFCEDIVPLMYPEEPVMVDIAKLHVLEDFRHKFIPDANDYLSDKQSVAYAYEKTMDFTAKGMRRYYDKQYIHRINEVMYATEPWLTKNSWFIYSVLPLIVTDHYQRTNAYDYLRKALRGTPYNAKTIAEAQRLKPWMNNALSKELPDSVMCNT